jgi:hypothetical protein
MEKLTSDSFNFHTCRHRSDSEIEKLVKRCSCQGGNFLVKGYWCEKRELFQVTEGICSECQVYESK